MMKIKGNTEELYKEYESVLRERDRDANKNGYGRLLIAGGSRGMGGAPYLSGLGAFRSGIGMVRFLGPECNRQILQTLLPEGMYSSFETDTKQALKWADRIIAGPGLSTSAEGEKLFETVMFSDLSQKKMLLIDADGLNLTAKKRYNIKELCGGSDCTVILTPHTGEMSRLTGLGADEIRRDPGRIALEYAAETGAVVVLKDAVTYIAGNGELWVNDSGSPAMAKAGSGDVLTGVIAGVSAVMKRTDVVSAALGTYIHSAAGRRAGEVRGIHSILASDIAENIFLQMPCIGKEHIW